MANDLYLILESPVGGVFRIGPLSALARIVEAHPALVPLLDFVCPDPIQIALEIGMVSPQEEDDLEELGDIDLGLEEWFEPAAGLAKVAPALRAIEDDLQSIALVLYEPDLQPAQIVADLKTVLHTLGVAQNHEVRFHFFLETLPVSTRNRLGLPPQEGN